MDGQPRDVISHRLGFYSYFDLFCLGLHCFMCPIEPGFDERENNSLLSEFFRARHNINEIKQSRPEKLTLINAFDHCGCPSNHLHALSASCSAACVWSQRAQCFGALSEI